MRPDLRIAVAQTAPRLLEVSANTAQAVELASQAPDQDLLILPELALTGHGLGARVREVALVLEESAPPSPPLDALGALGPDVLVGAAERTDAGLFYNSSVYLGTGRIQAVRRKSYLPTYGMFDEARLFAPSRVPPRIIQGPGGWRIGVLICEDFWHPAMAWMLAHDAMDLLVVQAASPGRGGLRQDGSDKGGPEEGSPSDARASEAPGFRSMERWETLARATALQLGVFVALANRAGVEGGVTFGGGSLVVAPGGEILARAGGESARLLTATLQDRASAEARQGAPHLRDDDPRLLAEWHLERDARQ